MHQLCTGFPALSGEIPFVHPDREKKGFHNKSGDFVIAIGMMLKIHQNGWDRKNTGEFPMADVLSKLIR